MTITIRNFQEIETRFSSGVYAKRPVTLIGGEGAYVWDDLGNRYIDCVGGQGALNVGHAHPLIVEAIQKQAGRLISCPEMFHNDQRALLEEKLCQLTGMDRVFLSNSGTESVEAAIKFARILTGRTEIVAAMRGFHGRTMGALSATWEKKYRNPFQPLVPGFNHIPYNNLEALSGAVNQDTAAVLLEIVQGEGGVHPGSGSFLAAAQSICEQNGALLILDEIQTGFGRTGRMFAYQHHGLQPDILCLAKSIAGGLPMGATLLSPRLSALPPGIHGSTFGGNPLVCSAALAVLDVLKEEDLAANADKLGAWFQKQLLQIQSPIIREVRGLGLMVGVELKQKVTPILQSLMERGILALPAGLTVLRFLPPLVIEQNDLRAVAAAVEEILVERAERND